MQHLLKALLNRKMLNHILKVEIVQKKQLKALRPCTLRLHFSLVVLNKSFTIANTYSYAHRTNNRVTSQSMF